MKASRARTSTSHRPAQSAIGRIFFSITRSVMYRALTANPHEKLIFHKNWRRPARRVGMGCGGQDLRHLGSGFELGAIFELKPSLVPPFRGHARRGAVCSPLIVSRRPRAVGSSPRDGGGTSGLTPARFDLDVAPQSRLNLDALSTNTRWSLQIRAVRHDTRVPTLSEISRTPRIVSFRSQLYLFVIHA